MLKLFHCCIAQILLYGSEVWAPFMNLDWKKWDTTQIEKIHTQFLTRLKGVNRSTTNVLIRSEVGRHSLQEQILGRNINYIKYIENKDPSSFVQQAANYEILYIDERNSYSLLKKYEHNLVNRNNSNEEIRKLSKPKLCNIIKEEFNTLWQTQVTTFTEAETYTQFKNRVKFESYLADIKNRNHRVTFTKYRLSDHCLMIEKGRHTSLHNVAHIKIEMNYST